MARATHERLTLTSFMVTDPSSVTQGFPWSYLAAANTLGGQSAVGKVHQSGTQDFQQPGPTSRRNLHIPASLQHFQLMGDCSRPEMLKCNLCDATFRSASGLSGHRRRVHMKKSVYTCNICGMGFTMRGHFVGHMNMHNKVKAFKCPHCPRAFAYRTSLKSHLRLSLCGRQSPSTSAA